MSAARSWRFAVLLVGLALIVGLATSARERPTSKAEAKPPAQADDKSSCPFLPPLNTAEKKIEAALNSPTTLEFVETPLADVIEFLRDKHQIEIQMDRRALDDSSIATDIPVTKSLNGLSLASALDITLNELGLTWEIRHDVLLFTTPDTPQDHRTTRLYAVGDLVTTRQGRDDYAPLVDAITSTVAVGSWRARNKEEPVCAVKGATLGGAKVLSVSATYKVHRELAAWLTNVRRLAAPQETETPTNVRPARKGL